MSITTVAKDKVLNIELPEKFNSELLAHFDTESKSWLLSENQLYILDFKKAGEISPAASRVLVSFCSAVGKAQKKIVSVNVSTSFSKQFKKDGILDVLKVFSGPSLVQNQPPQKSEPIPALNVNLLNPIILSLINVLASRAKIKGSSGRPYLPEGTKNTFVPASIRGTIFLSSEKLKGELKFSFTEPIFAKIYEAVSGVEGAETKDMQEALSEFLAIVYEGAKSELEKVAKNVKPTFNTAVTGEQVKISAERAFIVPITTESGDFHIEVSTIAA